MAGSDPSRRREFHLGRVIVILLGSLTALALVACLTLKLLTDMNMRYANQVTRVADARGNAELVRVQIQRFSWLSNFLLVTHDAGREQERSQALASAYRAIEDLRLDVEPSEAPTVDKAMAEVNNYIAARHEADLSGAGPDAALIAITPALDAVYATLGDIARVQAVRLASERTRIRRWDRLADPVVWGIGALVALGSIGIAVAVYRVGFRPLLRLARLMRRFTGGDRAVRADPGRGVELARATEAFNEMADVITGQHARMVDFLGATAKELHHPVQIIRMSIRDLGPAKPPATAEKVHARLATVSRELDRLDRLVEGFIDLSRVEWRRLDLQEARLDLRGVAAEITQVYETFSSVHQVSIRSPDRAIWVRFDAGRLPQVVHALITNAIQLTPAGGSVKVTLATEEVEDAKEEAVLSVSNPGVTIERAEVGMLFEPFGALTGVRYPGPGTWVALAVARRIVEAHGGRIEAESISGQGTTVRVHLPVAADPPRDGASATRPGGARRTSSSPAATPRG